MSKFAYRLLRVAFVTFVGSAIPLLSGLGQNSWSADKDIAIAAITAGAAAAGHALIQALTSGQTPFADKGFLPPTH